MRSSLHRARVSWSLEEPEAARTLDEPQTPLLLVSPPHGSHQPPLLLTPTAEEPESGPGQGLDLGPDSDPGPGSDPGPDSDPGPGSDPGPDSDPGPGSDPGPDSDLGPGSVLLRSSPVICRRVRPVSWHGLNQLSPTNEAAQSEQALARSTEELSESEVCVQQEKSSSTEHRRSPSLSPKISARVFKSTCELDQENVHFILVDLVLEVLEGAKWRLSSKWDQDQDQHQDQHQDQDQDQDQDINSSLVQMRKNDKPDQDEQTQGPEQRALWETESELKTLSVLSTDSGFGDCSKASVKSPGDTSVNAEFLAQCLVQFFRQSWCPSRPHRGRSSLRSSLQELPGGACVVSSDLKNQIQTRTRMRGALSWTPPSVQIILTAHRHHRRSEVVAAQHFLCAGCGTELEPRHIKKLRYCEYLGRYFCACCHSGAEAVIPARVLSSWDFNRYPVSDFSKQLLDWVWTEPVLDLTSVPEHKVTRELHRFMELQSQLVGLKALLRRCRDSERVLKEFEALPGHVTQPPLVSLADLLRVKKGSVVSRAKAVMHSAHRHVLHCQLCSAQGFICEFCKDRNVIFPFQMDIYKRCPGCKKSFHKHCFVDKKCPNCAGVKSQRKHQKGSRK